MIFRTSSITGYPFVRYSGMVAMFPEGVNVVDKTLPGNMAGVGLYIFAGQGVFQMQRGYQYGCRIYYR